VEYKGDRPDQRPLALRRPVEARRSSPCGGKEVRMKRMKHWQDVVSVLVGVWLIASPWVLGIHGNLAAVGNCVAIGAVLVSFAMVSLFVPEPWEEWSEMVLGLWLIASPWILEYTALRVAVQNSLISGGVIVVLALWVVSTDDEYGWMHRLMHRH
jgi:hypothetical protein